MQEIEGLEGFYEIKPIKYMRKFEMYESFIIVKDEENIIMEVKRYEK